LGIDDKDAWVRANLAAQNPEAQGIADLLSEEAAALIASWQQQVIDAL
jgi:hypothetical protein